MKDNIFTVFEKECAEDTVKEKTKEYLYEEIKKRKVQKKRRLKRMIAYVAFTGVFFFGISFSAIYILPSAYIDIDVNPSIELTLNRFGKVIHSNAYNEDGTELLKEISIQNKNYNDAIKLLIDAMELAGYFKQNDKLLSVTVQTEKGKQESSILDGLEKSIQECNGEHHHNAITDIKAVTEEIKKEAKQEQLSPAKYLIIQDLLKTDENITMDECRNHSIEELQQSLQEHCKEHKEHSDNLEEESFSEQKHHGCTHHEHCN